MRIQRLTTRESINLVVALLLFVPGVIIHEPVFADGSGLRAAAGGVLLGAGLALASVMFNWSRLLTFATGVICYLGFGGLIALPQTTIAGFIPSIQTLQLLLVQPITSWKDLLTLAPPAQDFIGPTVLPYLVSFVAAIFAGRWVLMGRILLAALPLAVHYFIGAAWSIPVAPSESWWATGFLIALIAWWVANSSIRQGVVDHSDQRRLRWQRFGLAGTTLIASVLAALAITTFLVPDQPRTVLRSYFDPPLQVYEQPTPLQYYRHLNTDRAEDPLVTVKRLPVHSRLRVATLDTYDGLRWGLGTQATGSSFKQVGERIGAPNGMNQDIASQRGHEFDAEVSNRHLIQQWLPSIGHLAEIELEQPEISSALYYNYQLQALLTNMPASSIEASENDPLSYRIRGFAEPVWTEEQLIWREAGETGSTDTTGAPQSLATLASDVTATASNPLERARALEQYFHNSGYYANSTQYPSPPGHTTDRISQLIDADQMIGDDEQYATAMALAARSVNLPARVVMGFYPHAEDIPESEDTLEEFTFTGNHLHVWVEINFAGAGWIAFDPTPPRDQIPQTEVPEPQSVPRPQVLQPPEPPVEPPELPPNLQDDPQNDPDQNQLNIPWKAILISLLVLILLLIPLLVIPLWKRQRTKKRRQIPGREGVILAWEEVQDTAVDAGLTLPSGATIMESATRLDSQLPDQAQVKELGDLLSRTEFSAATDVTIQQRQTADELQGRITTAILGDSRWKRYRVGVSWRSLPWFKKISAARWIQDRNSHGE